MSYLISKFFKFSPIFIAGIFFLFGLKKSKKGQYLLIFLIPFEGMGLKGVGLSGYSDIAIGSRYHFIVFATSSGVPCIGLANGVYQKTKLKGVLDLYHIPDFFIEDDMANIEFNFLWSKIKMLIEKQSNIVTLLKEQAHFIENKSLITIKSASSLLNEK